MIANFVSVIIPVFNGEKTLSQCLDAVLQQNYENYEVIVVDNNSNDRTKEIIFKYKQRFDNLQYYFEGFRSRGVARNKGIDAAKGSVIAMTDCDCVVPRDWLSQLIKPIVEGSEAVVMGGERNIFKNFWTENIHQSNKSFYTTYLNGNYIMSLDTKNFAIQADVMKQFKFDSSLGNAEDLDLAFRINRKHKIRFLENLRVGHYHKTSFLTWVQLNFNRGFWAQKIYQKYHHESWITDDPMLGTIKDSNIMKSAVGIMKQITCMPFSKVYFWLVSDFSWRLGLIYGKKSN